MSTIKDVAKRAGVGVSTVSRYLQKKGYVSEKSKKKIEKAIEELNYYPNAIAQSIRSHKTKTIAFLIPSISNQFFPQLATYIENYLFEREYKMILCNTNGDSLREEKYIDMLIQNRIDGVISSTGDVASKLIEHNIPCITIDRTNVRTSGLVASVTSNNEMGGQQAANHLIDNGCKRLLCLHGPEGVEPAFYRRKGFVEAADARNIHVECIAFDSEYDVVGINNRYDGVFCWNDVAAISFIAKCQEKQIKIPEDLQVIGFDDIDLLNYYYPKLTTIHQPMDKLASKAVEMVLDRMIKEEDEYRYLLLDTKLIVRDTTKEK